LPFQSLTALALIVIIAYRTQEPPKCLLQSEKAKKEEGEISENTGEYVDPQLIVLAASVCHHPGNKQMATYQCSMSLLDLEQ